MKLNRKYIIFIPMFFIVLNLFNKYDGISQDLENINSRFFVNNHILGTDELGRDILARLVQGSLNTLIICISICFIIFIMGITLGYFMGISNKIDKILMVIIQFIMSISSLILTIFILVFIGNSMFLLIFSLSINRSLRMAIIVRNEVKKLNTQNFILISKMMGASSFHVLKKHILPNIIDIVLFRISFMIPGIIFSETFLSFMGIGVRLPKATLGNILSSGFHTLLINPTQFILVSVFIVLITLFFGGLNENT
ncbi:ABC transporter permease [Pseudostreptobacillus hongkongensis]|uniref:ABC transporter permease n=1 Tax=Pseudostreptobacillus hongkongensis TaxID=1162717 RepID=UPI0028D84F96|nr:ABC transporter permease [Pseudostreptobacillus hongkongensis]